MTGRLEGILGKLFESSEETSGSISGGLLLPEVFTVVLETLLSKGTANGSVLRREIREIAQDKSKRIRSRGWGSMDAFCNDMLYILQHGGYVLEEDDIWALTEKAVPGTRLTIFKIPGRSESRVRITFHDIRDREIRETVAEYWQSIGKLIRDFEGKEDLAPVLQKVQDWAREIQEVLHEAIQDPGKTFEEEDKPRHKQSSGAGKGKRKFPGQARWYREYVLTTGWHTMNTALDAWNDEHPDAWIDNVSYFSARNEANRLTVRGDMEKRALTDGRDFFEYRWIQQ